MTLEEKKTRLAELKAKLAQMKESATIDAERGGLQAAAERMMIEDPTGAFNLLDKSRALDIREQQLARDNQYDPDSVRFKLASRANAISGQLTGMPANNPAYKPLLAEQSRIKLELAKDNPSIKAVYADETPAEIIDPTGTATYDSIQADIKAATKGTYEAVKSKVATDKGIAKLSAEQEKRVDELLAQKRKELFPVAKKRPAESTKEARDSALGALGQLIKWSEAGRLDPNVPADRLLLAKIKSRDYASESYMSDDANLSANGVMQFFKNLSGIQELPLADAVKFKQEIPEKVRIAQEAVKVFLGDNYFDIVSKVLFDRLQAGLKNYPDRTQLLRPPPGNGSSSAGDKPKASDYPGDYPAYQKAIKAWKAKGGK